MTTARERRVLVLTYWPVSSPLVVNYTLPYLRIMAGLLPKGSRIHLVTLDKDGPGHGLADPIEGVELHSFRYRAFGLGGLRMGLSLVWSLARLIRREQIDTIHAWCTPAGALGYVLSLLTGCPLLIDSYEPHAEAMVENGTWKRGGAAHRILFLLEKKQTQRAWAVVSATEGMRDYARRRYGHVPGRFEVKPACVDLERFVADPGGRARRLRAMGLEGKLIGVYAGKFGGIYLGQEVFDLLKEARAHWGDRFHFLLLTPHSWSELSPWMEQAGLPRDMFTVRSVAPAEVPAYLNLADWALTPVKPVPTKRYCTPIKDGEYWAMGLPVMITPDISDDSGIIDRHGIGSVIHSLDPRGYRDAVARMDALLKCASRAELHQRIRPVAERYRNFQVARQVYARLYGDTGHEGP